MWQLVKELQLLECLENPWGDRDNELVINVYRTVRRRYERSEFLKQRNSSYSITSAI